MIEMNYKYIEQLVGRYFECETSLAEESILRTFFAQEQVPQDLMKYRSLFVMQQEELDKEMLGDDFDAKILQMAGIAEEEPERLVVKARKVSLANKLRPLFRAAAVVAIVFMVGTAAQYPYQRIEEPTMAMEQDTVTIEDPSVAQGDTLQIGGPTSQAIKQ